MTLKIIGYCRVSTEEQSRSGLGLEAQRAAIIEFCQRHGYELVDIVDETGSGAGSDALEQRPVLRKAMKDARRIGATVLVSKLDRLSRSVAFISTTIASGVPFMVANLGPDVPSLVLHVVAAVAEEERSLISKRTKEGLARLRQRIEDGLAEPGKRFAGNPRIHEAKEAASAARAAKADVAATKIWPVIKHYQQQGLRTRAIARKLNDDGHQTSRGSDWSDKQVARVIKRMEGREASNASMAA